MSVQESMIEKKIKFGMSGIDEDFADKLNYFIENGYSLGNRYDYFSCGYANDILQACGLKSDIEIVITQSGMKKILGKKVGKKDNAHDLTPIEVLRLPQLIPKPILVINGNTSDTRLIFVEIPRRGRKMFAVVDLDINLFLGKQGKYNLIASVYSQENYKIVEKIISASVLNNIHYYDSTKIKSWLSEAGQLQLLPTITTNSMFSEKDFPNDANIQKELFYPKENDKGMKGTKEKTESDNRNIIGLQDLNESVGNTEDNLTSSQKEVLSFIDKQIKTAQAFAQQPKGSVPSYMRQNMNGRVTGRLETLWRNRDYDTFNLALDKIKEAGVIFSKTNSIWERHKNTPMEDLYPSPEFKMAMKIIDGLKQNMTIDKDNLKWAIERNINKLATENRVRSFQVVVKALKEKQEKEELNLFPSDSWIWRYLKDDDEVVKQDNPESGVIYEADGCTVEDNIELSRVQISFPGKPSGEIISYLKQHGFRWSPSNMAWQRQNTPEGRRQALDFARKFFPDEIKKENEIEVKEEKGIIEETSAVEEINTPSGDESSLFDFAFQLSKKIENEKVTWVDAQKFASEMNVKASRQELIQACEMAVVKAAQRIASTGETIRAKYEQIRDLYDNQPTIAPKDGESRFLQQFSTPAPLAFMAGEFVKANKNADKYGSSYLEPSAGNGMLTIALDPLKTTVNEIDKIRYNNLVKLHYINVKNYDAASEEFTNEIGTNFTGIITNPPFADLEKNEYLTKIGKKGEREIEYTFSKLDHKLAIMALDKMADNGRAAIIVGGKLGAKMYGLRNSYWNRMDRLFGEYAIFIAYLHRQYNIVDILYISGNLYAKQGTTYPIIMILIDGRKKWDSRPECVWRKYDPEKDKEIMSFTEYFNRIYPYIEEQQTQATSEEDKERKLRLAKAKAKSLLLYAYAQKNKESKKEEEQDWLDSINADELRERLKQDNGEGEKLLQEAKRQLYDK